MLEDESNEQENSNLPHPATDKNSKWVEYFYWKLISFYIKQYLIKIIITFYN